MKRGKHIIWIELTNRADKDITLLTGSKANCLKYYKMHKAWWKSQGYPLHFGIYWE